MMETVPALLRRWFHRFRWPHGTSKALPFLLLGVTAIALGLWRRVPPDSDPFFGGWSLGLIFSGGSLVVLSLHRRRSSQMAELLGLAVLLALLLFFFLYTLRYVMLGQGSDSMLMSYTGAREVIAGGRPYSTPISQYFGPLNLPGSSTTMRMDGTFTDRITYPALNFLIFAPAVALGLHDLRWVVLGFHISVIAILFYAAPRGSRLLGALPAVLVLPYLGYTSGSITDMVWVSFLLAAIYLWYRLPLAAGVALGLACSFKQQAWVAMPFVAARLILEAPPGRRLRGALPTLGITGATFAAINLPFILTDPEAWLRATLDPILPDGAPMVVSGLGPSWLLQHGLLGTTRGFFSTLVPTVALALLLLYVAHFPTLRIYLWAFPALISLVDYRSLMSHVLYWALPLVLEAQLLTLRGIPTTKAEDPRIWRGLTLRPPQWLTKRVGTAAVVLMAVAVALASALVYDGRLHKGLDATLVGTPSDPQGWGALNTLQVRIRNPTDRPLRPIVAVTFGGWQPLYWERWAGPETLAAGAISEYTFGTGLPDFFVPVESPFYLHVNDIQDPDSLRVFGPFRAASSPPLVPNGDFALWHRDLSSGGMAPYRWEGIRSGSGEILQPLAGGVLLRCDQGGPGYVSLAQTTPMPEALSVEGTAIAPGDGSAVLTYSKDGHTLSFLLTTDPSSEAYPDAIAAPLGHGPLIPLGNEWRARGWDGGGVGTLTLEVRGMDVSLWVAYIHPTA